MRRPRPYSRAVADLSLDALVDLLVRGTREGSFSGVLERAGDDGRRPPLRVWRRGRLARFEEDGRTVLIAGEDAYLRHWPVDPHPVRLPRDPAHDDFEMSHLTMLRPERYWSDWLRRDTGLVESTLAPVDHEGRRAWRFVAPEATGRSVVLTVDARLGLVLQTEAGDLGVVEAWHEVEERVLDDALFSTEPGDGT